jgi:hypothetical protein
LAEQGRGTVDLPAQQNPSLPFLAKSDVSDDHQPTQRSVLSSFRDHFPGQHFHLPIARTDFAANRRPYTSHPRLEHYDISATPASRPPPFSLDCSATPHGRASPLDTNGNNQIVQDRKPTTGAKEYQSSRPASPNPFGDFINAANGAAAVTESLQNRKRKDWNEASEPLVTNALFYSELNSSKKRKDTFHTKCARPVLGSSTDICFFNEERKVDWYNRPLTSPVVLPLKVSHRSDTAHPAPLPDTFSSAGLDGSDDDLDLSGEKFLWP